MSRFPSLGGLEGLWKAALVVDPPTPALQRIAGMLNPVAGSAVWPGAKWKTIIGRGNKPEPSS